MAKKPRSSIRVKTFMGSRYSRKVGTSTARQTLESQFKAQVGKILENLQEFVDEVKDACPDILVEALEPTLGKAIEYCPKDSGELANSAYLEAEVQRGRAVVAIGFGRGGQPSYAIYVHEMPYAHEAPTRRKFLESALDEDYFSIVSSIPRLIRERAGT